MKKQFSVKELASLAGVTVRTLHLYDEIGLLSPANRSDAGYRWYGEAELFRLQQILFYKELDMPLKEIAGILDEPGFDLETALQSHSIALQRRQERINTMLNTIEKTISKLKHENMKDYKELYEGFTPELAEALHNEAVETYGKEVVETAEAYLGKLSDGDMKKLWKDQQEVITKLVEASNLPPDSDTVLQLVARHYKNTRHFWGTANTADKQADAYKGLGELYVNDERFTTSMTGKPNPAFAIFMRDAMVHFADTTLK